MDTTILFVILAAILLVMLMVWLAFAQPSTQLRAVAVSDAGPPDPLVPVSPGLGEHRRATDRPVEGYCVKDRAMVEMLHPEHVALRTGRLATVGVCSLCGTTIYKIEKTPDVVKARTHAREERERIQHARRETA